MAPSGLYARLCHAFLVFKVSLLILFSASVRLSRPKLVFVSFQAHINVVNRIERYRILRFINPHRVQ